MDRAGNAYGYIYLLSNGNLLASSVPDGEAENDREGMRHLVELDWNSDIIWQADAPGWHRFLPTSQRQHCVYRFRTIV